MNIHYDLEKLDQIARDLFGLLHLAILITDYNGNRLVKCTDPNDFCSTLQSMDPGLRDACHQSDKALMAQCRQTGATCTRICHMNLCDIALPIHKDGVLAAYILLGRMRDSRCQEADFRQQPELQALYRQRPYFTDTELTSLKSLLPVILFNDAIMIEKPDMLTRICAYIEANLSGNPSLETICKEFYISKNTVYRLFHREYNCTVGEFISQRRLKTAQKKLLETEDTVLSISVALGFSSYAYFCRFFKANTGLTPTEYRRQFHREPSARIR